MSSLLRGLLCIPLLLGGYQPASADENRRVAITFDDLPIAASVPKDAARRERITTGLLSSLTERAIPAVGFVNEQQLHADGALDPGKVELLRMWLDAGHELGNHTYSHPDLNRTPLEAFQADVLRGELVIEALLGEFQRSPRYFRHPFLHTGPDLETKYAFEAFLANHGYIVAPVTIDNSEWIFARAYDLAVQSGDNALAAKVGEEYVSYMLKMFEFYEGQSRALFDRNITHVLLLHANELNSAWFGALADRLGDLGYEFVTLDEALEDPAYDSEDAYVGPGGITWLHRWAITRNADPAMFRGEPETPGYILELTELREHAYEDSE